MPAKFEILRTLEEDSASALYLAREKKRSGECGFRRFRTRKPEEIEGLKELFGQLSSLDNPHLERALEYGTDKEGFFAITAPPEGETLEQALQRGPLTAEEFEVVALQLLEALEVLHEQAVVHGSIRPDYVRIAGTSRKDWKVTLGGFGQGFGVKDESKEAQIRAYRCTAPEQWQDGTTRRRTDVYALGCVLYEALAARPPFDGRALKELRMKHIGHDVAPLQKLASHVPAWMSAWVMHLMAADPEQRPRKAAVARELFVAREAPRPPELPPRTEASPAIQAQPSIQAADSPAHSPATTPPVSLGHQVSAPVVLPSAQTMTRNATSSTIPISAVPRRPASGPPGAPGGAARRPSGPTITAPRKVFTPPRRPPVPAKVSLKPFLIGGAAVLLLLLAFLLPRCGKKPAASVKPAAVKKK